MKKQKKQPAAPGRIIRLGDKVRKRLEWADTQVTNNGVRVVEHEYADGVVVYIHPAGRFYELEFTFPSGKFRESYAN